MKGFTLRLLDATRSEQLDEVVSFVGADASGSFGILAGHAPFITALRMGLARFRGRDGRWRYLALPEAVLRFDGRELVLGTRRYLLGEDLDQISAALRERLLVEERQLQDTRRSLRHMEEALMKRMWELGRQGMGSLA
ncbi:MAG TPA: F0F1 ATP synthase subunit epsilon [Steroidobacteraceae bacterium]|nr:F0F1 ATP synthase subunit epsilon [Steroidobacteraceae bacterium]